MIGYECLAGRRAFDGDNAVQIALMQLRDVPDPLPADVPENVRRLIGRALAKDPANRFADGAAFRRAVDDVLAGRMLTPLPVGSGTFVFSVAAAGPGATNVRAPGGWRRRVLAPALALFLITGAGVAALQIGADSTPPPAAAAAEPAPLILSAEDYVGRPVSEVEAELGALGLAVDRIAEETGAPAPGLVTGISPAGAVNPGDRIAVGYAVAPPPAVVPVPAPVPVPVPLPLPVPVSDAATGDSGADDSGGDESWNEDSWSEDSRNEGSWNQGNGKGKGKKDED
jgi:serine/threonine-protein kinase